MIRHSKGDGEISKALMGHTVVEALHDREHLILCLSNHAELWIKFTNDGPKLTKRNVRVILDGVSSKPGVML